MERLVTLQNKIVQMALDHNWPGKWRLNYTFPRIFQEGELLEFRDFLTQSPTKIPRRDIIREFLPDPPPDYQIAKEHLRRSLMVRIQDVPYQGKHLTALTFEGENATKRRGIYQERFLEDEENPHILVLRNLITVWDRVERIQNTQETQNMLLVIGRSIGDTDGTVEFYEMNELRQIALKAKELGIKPRALQ